MNARKPLTSGGAWRRNSRNACMTSEVCSVGQSVGPANTVSNGVRLEQERRDHAEVSTAAAYRPKEVVVLVAAGSDETAIREHDIGGQQVVDGKAVGPGEMPDPSAQRQAAHSGRRNEAARHSKPEGVGRVIDLAPQRARQQRAQLAFLDSRARPSCATNR